MQIKRLVIENFKSIERIELIEPNPFTVFVGPNGSGKSNVFEALEFMNMFTKVNQTEATRRFGGADAFINRKLTERKHFAIYVDFDQNPYEAFVKIKFDSGFPDVAYKGLPGLSGNLLSINPNASNQFFRHFGRIFINSPKKAKGFLYEDNYTLNFSATNLEPVLRRILTNTMLREEISEWLDLLIPGFKVVEVDDNDELHWFEESSDRHFTKDLISDGTYNILALLTAVYQSDDKPQFLCIEEPENGLHPQVARELVDFFRLMCEERGHYIWLNTHSPYMVSRVKPEELVVVDKVNGATQTKQFKGEAFDGMRMDEAWLTNVLNGGKAW